MPEIPLSTSAGALTGLDRLMVLAVMRRPWDADIARKVLVAVRAAALTEACRHHPEYYVTLPVGDLALLQAESPSEVLSGGKNCFGGWVAGEILLLILNLAEHAPEHASVNRAVRVLVDDLAKRKLRNGREAPCSRALLLAEWSNFRPAAHLWAAYNIYAQRWGGLEMSAIELLPEKVVDLSLLATAAELARSAAGIVPRGRQRPILDPGELWTIPDALPLPRIDFQIPALTDWAQVTLREYPAELRRARNKKV
jgi:hypothetical protein